MFHGLKAADAASFGQRIGTAFAAQVERHGAAGVEGHMLTSSSVGKAGTPDHFVMGSIKNGVLKFSAEPERGSPEAVFYESLIKTFNDHSPQGIRAELRGYGAPNLKTLSE